MNTATATSAVLTHDEALDFVLEDFAIHKCAGIAGKLLTLQQFRSHVGALSDIRNDPRCMSDEAGTDTDPYFGHIPDYVVNRWYTTFCLRFAGV